MHDEMRGKIRNKDHARQLRDFSGLKYGKITPTDIDGFIDFGNKVFVFIETKHGDPILPTGQRLVLERICDACQKSGIPSIVIVGCHDDDYTKMVDVAYVKVGLYYKSKEWRKPKETKTVKQCINWFLLLNDQSGFLGITQKRRW